jgi:hypothetical protein
VTTPDPIETMPLPALAGMGSHAGDVKAVRPLTEDELAKLNVMKTLNRLAAPIMQMFGMLTLNHAELKEFAAELECPTHGFKDPSMQLNRHVLNYLASANALLGHFGVTFKQRCREVGNPDGAFDAFVRKLKDENDVFEFFCEFRNHALHVGLPVGNITYTKHIEQGHSIAIFHKASQLSEYGSRALKQCRLLKSIERIELLPRLDLFHKVFMDDVFGFIMECLLPGLKPASVFHRGLTAEVKALGAEYKPMVMIGREKKGREFKWQFEQLPEDVFKELGISVRRQPQERQMSDPGVSEE